VGLRPVFHFHATQESSQRFSFVLQALGDKLAAPPPHLLPGTGPLLRGAKAGREYLRLHSDKNGTVSRARPAHLRQSSQTSRPDRILTIKGRRADVTSSASVLGMGIRRDSLPIGGAPYIDDDRGWRPPD